jgi:hypothetical protein
MIKSIGSCVLLVSVIGAGLASPAYAQRPAPAFGDASKHTINVTFGLFVPRGEEGRGLDDVLTSNCDRDPLTGLCRFLEFDIDDFKSFTIGGEWLIPIGGYVEVGAGVGFTTKEVPSIYADWTDSDGTEVDQTLSLRQIPLSFTARVLPFGQSNPVQPYVGGGLGMFFWKYTEAGEFIDFSIAPPPIFEATFEESGMATGPIFLAGIRYATPAFAAGFEVRYQNASGELDPTVFAGSKIDLTGWTYQGTIGFRF